MELIGDSLSLSLLSSLSLPLCGDCLTSGIRFLPPLTAASGEHHVPGWEMHLETLRVPFALAARATIKGVLTAGDEQRYGRQPKLMAPR